MLNTTFKRIKDKLLSSDLINEIIMMNTETGDYMGLNEVGTSIWNLLESPISGAAICAQLLKEYEIDRAICEAKTLDFLQLLLEEGMIQVHEGAICQ